MRDPLAPVINGFDFSGIVNRYSFQCDQFYTEGDNGGTLLDGSTVTDVLAAHVRLSWTLNSVSSAQYAAITDALGAGDSPDTVNAYVFDPSADALRLAKFHVTRPPFNFAFDMDAGKMMSYAGGELVLEEASAVARFAVTPPTKTAYVVGEPLDLTGFSVTSFDSDGVPADITAQCTTVPANGTPLEESDRVSVSLPGATFEAYSFDTTVEEAEIIASGDWWTLYADGLLSVFCVGDMPMQYPESSPWRSYNDSITEISIANSVTATGNSAFRYCANLTSVTIPNSVTSIAYQSFYGCTSLTSVTIPNSVTSIGERVFYGCTSLTNAQLSNNLASIPQYAFQNCSALASITIPGGVTSINTSAFHSCTSLTSVTIPDSVTSIGEFVFHGCTSLTNARLPDNLTSIPKAMFWNCSSLAGVTIPNSVTSIGNSAFGECASLTSVTIPDSVTSIGSLAFQGCTSLSNIRLPNNLTSIQDGTFRDCSALAGITIPDSVTSIEEQAFEECSHLTDVYYTGTETQWNAITIDPYYNNYLRNATIHYNSSGPT